MSLTTNGIKILESAQDLSCPLGYDRTVWFNYGGTEVLLDGVPATARPDAPHSIGSTLQLAILAVPVNNVDHLGPTLLQVALHIRSAL